MIDKVKKYLKNIVATHPKYEARRIIRNLVDHPDLSQIEQWLIYYAFAEQRMVANTCDKLGLGECDYHFKKKLALTKLYYILELNKTA